MTRPHSRAEIRKRAMLAFAARNRQLVAPGIGMLRAPEPTEVPLSDDEVQHGLQRGLIAARPSRGDHSARDRAPEGNA